MWAPLHLPCDTKQKADDLFFVFVAVLFVVVVFVVIVAIVLAVVVFVLTVFIIVDFIAFIVFVVVLHFSFHVILRIRSRMRIICFGPHIFDISLRLVVSNSLKKRGFSVL